MKIPSYILPDEHYRARAARRARLIWLAVLVLASAACLYSGLTGLFYDTCTRSFTRDPRTVLTHYVAAISAGDGDTMAACWDRSIYSLDTGCSEICLQEVLGAQFTLQQISLSPPVVEDGRAQIIASVSVSCTLDPAQAHAGEITLDALATTLPWRHWKIIHSTFGGLRIDPWCK